MLGAFAGILIAATVVSGAPIYLRSLEQVGIERSVERLGSLNRNVIISSSWIALDQSEYERNDGIVQAAADRHIGDLVVSESLRIKSRGHFWDFAGIEPNRGPLASRAYFQLMDGLEDHVIFLDGRPPTDEIEVLPDGTQVVEVGIYQISRATRRHGTRELIMRVGDVIEAIPEDRGVGRVRAVVTGIFVERDNSDPFWNGTPRSTLDPSPPVAFPERDPPFVLFTSGDSITRAVGPVDAGLPADYTWIFFTDPEKVSHLTAKEIEQRIDNITADIERGVVRPHIISSLGPLARVFQQKMLFLQIPMFLLAALALSVVGYYLFLVSGLIARRRERDTVMLRSRGVSVRQVVAMYALEGAVIVGIPVLIAPLVAVTAVAIAGYLPVYDAVSEGGVLPAALTWKAWMWSAVAGVFAFGVMVLPPVMASRNNVADERASVSRPDRPPLFQRYYLDIVALALGGLVFWELDSRGTIISRTRTGEVEADMTLLFAPVIFLVGVALIFLRLFPLAAKLAAWMAGRSGSASLSIGFWRVGRSPYWYSWPVLVLVLASGLGVLAGTLGSTLQRSSEEQILYETGADLRIKPSGVRGVVTNESMARIRAIDGVEVATPAYRSLATIGTTRSGPSFEMFAVDARDFPRVGWFREDFSDQPMEDLLRQIDVVVEPDPITIPEGTQTLGMWAKADPFVNDMFLWLILRDARGRTETVTLSQIESEWTFKTAAMPANVVWPIELVSIQTFMQAGADGGAPTTVFFDDLTAFGDGVEEIIVDFETPGLWTPLPTSNGLDAVYSVENSEPVELGGNGGWVARVQLGRGTDGGVRGLYRTATGGPLPVIASETFLSSTNTPIGLPFVVSISGGFVPVVAIGQARFFPTLDQADDPFLVADVDSFVSFIGLRGLRTTEPNEVFAKIDRTRHGEIAREIISVYRSASYDDRQAMLDASLIDPLTVAGWRGMTVLSLIMTGVATALGYITYLVAHEARTRHDTAYMRAIGLSRLEFLRIVVIEHFLIGVLGVALGVVTGLGVSRIAVSSMAHTATGRELLPPFILQTDWLPTVIIVVLATVTAAVIVAGILRAYPRLPLHVLTRTSE